MTMSRRNGVSPKDFLVGAAIGGVLGTVTALLMAPKSGEGLRQGIYDTYSDVTEKIGKKKKSFAKEVEDIKDWIYPNGTEAAPTKEFIVGGLAGGIIGAVAALLLTPKAGVDFRQDLADAYEDASERTQELAAGVAKRGKKFAKRATSQANDWLDVAQGVLSYIAEEAGDKAEDFIEQAEESFEDSKIKKIIDWATLGVSVLQQVKKRR